MRGAATTLVPGTLGGCSCTRSNHANRSGFESTDAYPNEDPDDEEEDDEEEDEDEDEEEEEDEEAFADGERVGVAPGVRARRALSRFSAVPNGGSDRPRVRASRGVAAAAFCADAAARARLAAVGANTPPTLRPDPRPGVCAVGSSLEAAS